MLDWQDLPSRSNDELGRLDPAEVHLACAAGLPGAERLDVDLCLEQLDDYAQCVGQFTERMWPTFCRRPDDFRNSEAYFRMLCLVTVLQRDLGVRTTGGKLNHNPNFSDAEDLFLHGILEGKGGTCSSLPPLYVAVGRRLGYPLKLARTAHHLFARWEEAGGERFNIECTSRGLDTPTDEHYRGWPESVPPLEFQAGLFLQTMTPRQEVAGWLIQRAACLRDNHRYQEAVEACIGACVAAPEDKLHERSALKFMDRWRWVLRKRMPAAFPKVIVLPPVGRRFPASIPYAMERDLVELETTQRLLDDPEKERKWWRLLRQATESWPRRVPTRVEVTKHGRGLFMRQEGNHD